MATFVGVGLPKTPVPEVVSAPEGSTPWSIMGVWCSLLVAPRVSSRAAAWSTVPFRVRRALEAATVASVAAHMS